MFSPRVLKALLVAMVFLYMVLVALGNILDPAINFAFVKHVLSMDTVFPDNSQRWRAITSPFFWELGYGLIISYEVFTAGWLGFAAYRMFSEDKSSDWAKIQSFASAALVATMILWLVPFITIGGEWFQMWQSTEWNGIEVATRNFLVHGLILLYLQTPDVPKAI